MYPDRFTAKGAVAAAKRHWANYRCKYVTNEGTEHGANDKDIRKNAHERNGRRGEYFADSPPGV